MNILMINPPMQVDMQPEIPPLGMAYVSQELKRKGHKVDILDIDSYRYAREDVSARILASSADVFGIGGLVTAYPYLSWLVPEIRRLKPGKKIILGGALASSLREVCFNRFDIDYIVIGEGEVTTPELLETIEHSGDLHAVKGIGFRDGNGRTIITDKRPLMPSLEEVPTFDDEPFPMEKLLKNTNGTLQIHAQRGCPSSCTFCFNCYRVTDGRVRYRPAEKVIDEIEYFKKKFGDKIKLFALSGECITMNKDWIIGFCREIIRRGLKIKYRVTSRVDTIDEERLGWLRDSGCVTMSLGLESGSDKILKIMKKGATAEKGKRAVMLAKRYIPEIEACIILGYIGEDMHTLRDTVDFAKEIGVRPALFFATPFPGTELYNMAIEKGRIRDEETFRMGLDKVLTFNFSINLTDMTDDAADKALKSAVHDIERHYLRVEFNNFRLVRRVWLKLAESGPKRTVSWALKRVGEVFFDRA